METLNLTESLKYLFLNYWLIFNLNLKFDCLQNSSIKLHEKLKLFDSSYINIQLYYIKI